MGPPSIVVDALLDSRGHTVDVCLQILECYCIPNFLDASFQTLDCRGPFFPRSSSSGPRHFRLASGPGCEVAKEEHAPYVRPSILWSLRRRGMRRCLAEASTLQDKGC